MAKKSVGKKYYKDVLGSLLIKRILFTKRNTSKL